MYHLRCTIYHLQCTIYHLRCTIYNVPVTICLLISSASIHTGTWASSPATLGAKRRFRSEDGERKLAEMTIFADRCCPCGEVKAKKEYQEGGDLFAPSWGALIPHPSSLIPTVSLPLSRHRGRGRPRPLWVLDYKLRILAGASVPLGRAEN